jgi:hypothetical protein
MSHAAAAINESDRRHFLRVSNHNFHDATLEQIRVLPARSKRDGARIEVLLWFPHVELRFSLTFTGCTNVSLALDFGVLADNLDYNTAGFSTLSDAAQTQQFIRSQIPVWNMQYDDTGSESPSSYASGTSPLNAKLARAASLTLHRVSYFGGELSVVATSHKVRRIEFNANDRKA